MKSDYDSIPQHDTQETGDGRPASPTSASSPSDNAKIEEEPIKPLTTSVMVFLTLAQTGQVHVLIIDSCSIRQNSAYACNYDKFDIESTTYLLSSLLSILSMFTTQCSRAILPDQNFSFNPPKNRNSWRTTIPVYATGLGQGD